MTRATPLAQELGLIGTLWIRELLRFSRERFRWAGALVQPVILWLILGTGLSGVFQLPGASDVSSLQYLFPGVLVMIVLFTTIFTTISVVEDRASGFLQSVLVAPGSRAALVLGKVAGVVTLTLFQCTVYLLLAPLAGYAIGDVSWWRLGLVTTIACIGMTGMNFTVAWVLNSVQSYHAVMSVVLIPLWFFSGALFPRPESWLGDLMLVNPLTYAVDGVRSALDPGGAQGVTGFGPITSGLVLVVHAVFMVALATWVARRGADRTP